MRASAPVNVPAGNPATTCMPVPLPIPVVEKVDSFAECAAVQGSSKP